MYVTKLLSGCDHGLDCPFDIRLPVCVPYSCSESESDAPSLLNGAFKEKGHFMLFYVHVAFTSIAQHQ